MLQWNYISSEFPPPLSLAVSLSSSQNTPSGYLAEMRLTTEERLSRTTEMYPPQIVELLDIGVTSHQKVHTCSKSPLTLVLCSQTLSP